MPRPHPCILVFPQVQIGKQCFADELAGESNQVEGLVRGDEGTPVEVCRGIDGCDPTSCFALVEVDHRMPQDFSSSSSSIAALKLPDATETGRALYVVLLTQATRKCTSSVPIYCPTDPDTHRVLNSSLGASGKAVAAALCGHGWRSGWPCRRSSSTQIRVFLAR